MTLWTSSCDPSATSSAVLFDPLKTSLKNPSRKRSSLLAKAEHWESATRSHCKTRLGLPKVVSQAFGFTATRRHAYNLGQSLQEFMQTSEECIAAKLSMNVPDLVEQKG